MSKSINARQTDMLVNKMQENQEIARGFVKENKQKISEFWKQLTFELNSAGPPVKSEFEWKKVWTDQKRYVRKKAALNKLHHATGGGRNKTQKFSPTEEAIFQFVGMKEADEGVFSSQSFGLNLPQKRKLDDIELPVEQLLDEIENDEQNQNRDEVVADLTLVSFEVAPENNTDQTTSFASTSQNTQKMKTSKMGTQDVVIEKLQTQKELCAKVGEAVAIMKDHNKEIQNCFKKICRSLDSLNDKKKEQLEEEKRHNIVMENHRKTEIENTIEKNRRMIELEEMKIEIMLIRSETLFG